MPGQDLDQLRAALINNYEQIGPIWA